MSTSPQEDDPTVARPPRANDHDATGADAELGADGSSETGPHAIYDTPSQPLRTMLPRSSATMARPADRAPVPAGNLGLFVPGFVITGEIARGGMGVVLAAIEVALNREVAIKMLLPGAAGAERAARRFTEEARITARLQHPGIPSIYQVGSLADGRPFLAMKLIRGRTLAAILTAREQRPSSRSADELDLTALDSPGLLHIFEQICHAVGYAHANGVIHRDLKPANVMVGGFGEVFVMDWGLAKSSRNADCRLRHETGASNPQSNETPTGRAMGTPNYMPPEQARGDWQRVDARADVFALGGILATILTGNPPYTGVTPYAVLKRAESGDLAECYARLDASGANRELIDLTKWCLAPRAEDRPLNAGEVAQHIAAYRLSVEARLVAAEAERAAVAAKMEEMRRRANRLDAARRVAEDRAEEAEWFALAVREKARTDTRRWLGISAAIIVSLLVLAGVYGNYRADKAREAQAAPTSTAPR